MRYKLNEDIILAGNLPPGSSVGIQLLNMETDTIINTSTAICSESAVVPGLYTWSTSNITDSLVGYVNVYYEIAGGSQKVSGKFIYGGYIEDDSDKIDNLDTKIDDIPTAVWNHQI